MGHTLACHRAQPPLTALARAGAGSPARLRRPASGAGGEAAGAGAGAARRMPLRSPNRTPTRPNLRSPTRTAPPSRSRLPRRRSRRVARTRLPRPRARRAHQRASSMRPRRSPRQRLHHQRQVCRGTQAAGPRGLTRHWVRAGLRFRPWRPRSRRMLRRTTTTPRSEACVLVPGTATTELPLAQQSCSL